ncbi:4Fe-4S dicluster domain-containing protein [Candidatus Venteria ishoeyi]|uniref:4Fe-4S dicluster domain-containing protein n=1 Tax=Candidatus Venteria ishoeyi TaxID=1899563 RepID=UPI0025A5D02F|nr:4Fe-4S dicluster domain-containing protein [Candidatus Venteria ishoeyi]MDM8545929.1 4Fe-4S dicluster domain-containing protein [Candidatus Venteria ishoeyi]
MSDIDGQTQDRQIPDKAVFLPLAQFQQFLELVQQRYKIIGPVVKDEAIQYQPINDIHALTRGIRVEQNPGQYSLEASDNNLFFAWSNGAQALKPLLFSPKESLWQAQRDEQGRLGFVALTAKPTATAVIGVRACDLAALALQDQHFLEKAQPDPQYQARRQALFLIGVDCTHPANTCFCAATHDGPALQTGFDIALSELAEGFLLRPGSRQGRALLAQLDLAPATATQQKTATQAIQRAADMQQRCLPEDNSHQQLYNQAEHPHWQAIAERCLACGNCTMVCPTCFCYSAHTETALDGGNATQVRQWDSCFSHGHSNLHGHPVRADIKSRYRQWLSHKLTGWLEQFGKSGCVGCGRCITWCPVGIDLTAEAQHLTQPGESV